MLYRVLTELKNKDQVAGIVAKQFDCFSLIEASGYWKLRPEPSLIVEVETDDLEKVTAAALGIKNQNDQQAVMIQRIPNHAWLV